MKSRGGHVWMTLCSIALLSIAGCSTEHASSPPSARSNTTNAINKSNVLPNNAPQTNSGNTPISTATTNQEASSFKGYLYYAPESDLMFLTFSIKNGAISGTAYNTYIDSNNQVESYTWSLSGQESGTNINFIFNGSSPFSGTIKGKNIDLAVPDSSGAVQIHVYAPGTLGEYNADVSQLQATAASAQQAQAQLDSVHHTESDITNLVLALNTEFNYLQQYATAITNDLNTTQKDFAKEQSDFASEQKLMQQAGSAPSAPHQAVQYASDVSDDASKVANDQSQFNLDVSEANSEISVVQQTQGQLNADMAKVPFYKVGSIPSGTDISSTISSLQSEIRKNQPKVNDDAQQAQVILNQSTQIL